MKRNATFYRLLVVLFIVLTQVIVMFLRSNMVDGFGSSGTIFNMIYIIVLNLVAGSALSLLLAENLAIEPNSKLAAFFLIGLFPFLIVSVQMAIAIWGMDAVRILFANLGAIRFIAMDWIVNTDIPAFWLGLVIGWSFKRQLLKVIPKR
jgi:hypothetical protein